MKNNLSILAIIAIVVCVLFPVSSLMSFMADASIYYTTSAGAGSKDGSDWANAFQGIETGGTNSFEYECETNATAGDIYYIAGGTYTMTSNMDCDNRSGSSASPIKYIGVDSGTTAEPPTISDWANGTDRPFFTDGGSGYSFEIGAASWLYNTRHSKTGAGHMSKTGADCILFNVYMIMNSNDHVLWTTGGGTKVIYSELTAPTQGSGKHLVGLNTFNGAVLYSYLHDGYEGVSSDLSGHAVIGNIFDNLTVGVDSGGDDVIITGNTFYDVTTAIDGETEEASVLNNLFDECTAPIDWNADKNNFFGYNSYDGDESSNVNVAESGGSIDTDITLTAPADKDFTLTDSQSAEGVGLIGVGTNLGLVGDYNTNIGADQTDTQTGGGSSAEATLILNGVATNQ